MHSRDIASNWSSAGFSQNASGMVEIAPLLQPVWDWVRVGNEHIIGSPVFAPAYALMIDYFFIVFFVVLEQCFGGPGSRLSRYKLQPDDWHTWSECKRSLQLQFWNNALVIWPLVLLQAALVPAEAVPRRAPGLLRLVSQLAASAVIFDFLFWAFHVLEHRWRLFYKLAHSTHHEHTAPSALSTAHMQVLDLLIPGLFATYSPWLAARGRPHPFTFIVWFALSQYLSYEVHFGYDFPFGTHRFVPYYGGAPAHDLHHKHSNCNFEPWFTYLDRAFGYSYEQKYARRLAAKAKRDQETARQLSS